MKTKVTWKLDLALGDLKIPTLQDTMQVEATDKCDVYIEKKTRSQIKVQPGRGDDIQFLLIMRDPKLEADPTADPEAAPDSSKQLAYKIGDHGKWVPLDYVHLLIGNGALNLLTEVPGVLHFDNRENKGVWITVLVGRKASSPENYAQDANAAEALRNMDMGGQVAVGQQESAPAGANPTASMSPAQTAPGAGPGYESGGGTGGTGGMGGKGGNGGAEGSARYR